MSKVSIVVHAEWDDEAKVWFATSSDIEGLAVEGETFEQLQDKVVSAIQDLAGLNGIPALKQRKRRWFSFRSRTSGRVKTRELALDFSAHRHTTLGVAFH